MSKRQAGVQITREQEEREQEDDLGRDGPPDPVEIASAEVLAMRKIAMPKSRKRPAAESTEEKKPANPFAFGSAPTAFNNTSNDQSKPASSKTSTTASQTSNLFTFSSKASTTPAFPFAAPAVAESGTTSTIDEPTTVSSSETPEEATNVASTNNDSEYDLLLRLRSLNHCFHTAVKSSLENDPLADLSVLVKEYQSHKESLVKVPVEPAKNTNGTNIYPSFKTSQDKTCETKDAECVSHDAGSDDTAAKPQDKPSGFSLDVSAPAFSFKAPEASKTGSSFKFGEQSDQPAKSVTATPAFSFGLPPSTKSKEGEPANAEGALSESAEKKANDFSWSPDRGIKFGTDTKATVKSDKPVFSFNNPLTSPEQKFSDPSAASKPAATGFQFGGSSNTGFSFGLSTKSEDNSQKEDKETEPATATSSKPVFAFGAAPTFSFGQSTTPVFSFGAAQKSALAPDAKSSTAPEALEKDGDAMPEEPRTNDALIAGPAAGEEDEDEVYSVPRAKLFKFNGPADEGNPWSDLGICVVRVLVHKETKKARILARSEGAGAVRLNARLYSHLQYTHEGKSNVKLFDLQSATETVTYLIKVKEKAVSEKLVEVLNESKK